MDDIKKVIVRTEGGTPGSLKRSVKIAFVITPYEPNGQSHPYSPVAHDAKTFNADDTHTVIWQPKFFVEVHTARGRVLRWSDKNGPSISARPGQVITLNPRGSWIGPTLQNAGVISNQPSLVIENKSGSTTNILLSPFHTRIAYYPLETGRSITVPSSWTLQAYIVKIAVDTTSEKLILQPDDLKLPIFPIPIFWDALPKESTWTLTEDNEGGLRLHNDQDSPVEATVQPITTTDPLTEVLKRLAVMEKSINRIQDDVAAGQKAVDDIRDQLLATKGEVQESRSSITAGEARTAILTGSFKQSQDRLTDVRRAVTSTQRLLSGVEKTTKDLNHRLPLVESQAVASLTRLSALEESVDRTRTHVATVEKALHQTQDHVSLVQQMVLAKQPPGSGTIPPSQGHPLEPDGRIPAVEAKVEKLAQEHRKVVRMIDRRIPVVEARADKLQADLGVVQVSVAGLDRRVNAIETASGDDEGGAGSSSIESSPVMFPNHLADGPPAI